MPVCNVFLQGFLKEGSGHSAFRTALVNARMSMFNNNRLKCKEEASVQVCPKYDVIHEQ